MASGGQSGFWRSQPPVTDSEAIHLLFDAGVHSGLGHLRRMEALRQALERLGRRCVANNVRTGVHDQGLALVVDSYDLRADRICFQSGPVVAIDDLDRDLEVDLLVEPAPPLASSSGRQARRWLAGFEFALLENLGGMPDTDPKASSQRVIVSLGGADTAGRGARIAAAIARSAARVRVSHAPGPWSAVDPVEGVDVQPRAAPLLGSIRSAAIVVCAGGVTMLEAMMLGRATIAVEVASNQRRAILGASEAGAVLQADADDPDTVCRAVRAIQSDARLARRLSERGRQLVDGRGADRVASAIDALIRDYPDCPSQSL